MGEANWWTAGAVAVGNESIYFRGHRILEATIASPLVNCDDQIGIVSPGIQTTENAMAAMVIYGVWDKQHVPQSCLATTWYNVVQQQYSQYSNTLTLRMPKQNQETCWADASARADSSHQLHTAKIC